MVCLAPRPRRERAVNESALHPQLTASWLVAHAVEARALSSGGPRIDPTHQGLGSVHITIAVLDRSPSQGLGPYGARRCTNYTH